MRGLLRSIAMVLALAGCAASEDSDAARERRCERLRDHLVGLRLVGANVDLEAHRAAIKQALGHKFIDTCASGLTTDQINCALAESDSARALECTRSSASTN
jgi:hypothetical protein